MSPLSQIPSREVEAEDRFESLICEIATRFISLPAQQVDLAIENAQRRLCEGLGLDRSTLWQPAPARPGVLLLTHLHQSDDPLKSEPYGSSMQIGDPWAEAPERHRLNREVESSQVIPWISGRVQQGQTVVLDRLDELPREAAVDAEMLRRSGSLSKIAMPLRTGADALGCLTFATLGYQRAWTGEDLRRLKQVSHVFGRVLARKRSDFALRESEACFRTVADLAPVLIWMSDVDDQCFFFNRSWLEFTGRSLAQELGKGWMEGVHPQDRNECLSVAGAFAARKPFVIQWRLRRQDGVYRWIVDSGVPRWDAQGQFRGYIGSCVDISERIEAEEAARDLSGRLINAQELERAKIARELHDDVVQRLARLAIDVGRIERGGSLEPQADELLRGVHAELVHLSNDVHSLSYELHPSTVVDLGLVEALNAECEQISRRSAITAHVTVGALPPAIPSDMALCLFRIAQEALRNAVKHGRASKAQVTLWGVDSGVQLVVHDNGVGFSPSKHRHAHSLGLASMRERARILGGTLDVESQPDEGTVVAAWVPLREGTL